MERDTRIQRRRDRRDTLLALAFLAIWVVLLVVLLVDTKVDPAPEDLHPHREMPE